MVERVGGAEVGLEVTYTLLSMFGLKTNGINLRDVYSVSEHRDRPRQFCFAPYPVSNGIAEDNTWELPRTESQ